MRVASVCSSVGGLDLGLHRAGHDTVFLCEFDPWRRTVLARHWPGVPIHPDLKELRASDIPACDLFVGGTPCQDLSHAGKRAGLDGERSGLFHAFAQLRIDLYDLHGCAWSLWENVAGALSSNDGADFATVLASHVGADVPVPAAGWSGSGLVAGPWGTAEWRLLDAQFFGVPQRRRRVFVVGHLGADHPVEVLADGPRGDWDSAAGGEARTGLADGPSEGPVVAGSLTARYRKGVDSDAGVGQVVVGTLKANAGKGGSGVGPETPLVAGTLRSHPRPGSNSLGAAVAFHMTQDPITGDVSSALGTNMSVGATTQQGVRRLTPTECERLMGWPDGWTHGSGPSLVDAPQGWPGTPAAASTAFDWQAGAPASDGNGGQGRKWIVRAGDYTGAIGTTKVDAVYVRHDDDSAIAAPFDPQPDGRRYSACGDGVVAHVAEWIGLGFPATTDAQEGTTC